MIDLVRSGIVGSSDRIRSRPASSDLARVAAHQVEQDAGAHVAGLPGGLASSQVERLPADVTRRSP